MEERTKSGLDAVQADGTRGAARRLNVKTTVKMVICVLAFCGAAALGANTLASVLSTARASGGYVLGESGGMVVIFDSGDLKHPLEVTDIEVSTLRETDRRLLREGLPAQDKSVVLELLEDLGS